MWAAQGFSLPFASTSAGTNSGVSAGGPQHQQHQVPQVTAAALEGRHPAAVADLALAAGLGSAVPRTAAVGVVAAAAIAIVAGGRRVVRRRRRRTFAVPGVAARQGSSSLTAVSRRRQAPRCVALAAVEDEIDIDVDDLFADISAAPQSMYDLEQGMELEGAVLAVREGGCLIDVGVEGPGWCPKAMISDDFFDGNVADKFSVGDILKCYVANPPGEDGRYTLSLVESKARGFRGFGAPAPDVSAFEPGQKITGKVVTKMDYGFFLDETKSGISGLLHNSQIEEGKQLEEGDEVEVFVASVDSERGKLSLTMLEGEIVRPVDNSKAVELFKNVDPTTWITGKVVSVQQYGAFVEVAAPEDESTTAQGLLHVREIGGFVDDARNKFQVGEEVKVRCLQSDWDELDGKLRMSLSMKEPVDEEPGMEDVDLTPFADIPANTKLRGTVTGVVDWGAFVKVSLPSDESVKAQGLVHISQISDGYVENIADTVKKGDSVQVSVLGVDPAAGKMSLSMASVNPYKFFEDTDPTEWITGNVQDIGKPGVFVELRPPADPSQVCVGLVNYNGMKADFDMKSLKVGEKIQVRVLNVEAQFEQIELSLLEQGESRLQVLEDVSKDEWLTAKVSNLVAYGAFMEVSLPDKPDITVRGLLRFSDVTGDVKELEEGQELKVRLKTLDLENNRFDLTMQDPGVFDELAKVDPTTWLDGKVVSLTDFGAFVEFTSPADNATMVQGLVYRNEIKRGLVNVQNCGLKPGQDVKVRVLEVKTINQEGKVTLTMLDLPPSQSALEALQKLDASTMIKATVTRLANFGAFVEAVSPADNTTKIEGLVHISQLDADFVQDVAEAVEVGQEVEVRVVSVDPAKGLVGFSMRPEESLPAGMGRGKPAANPEELKKELDTIGQDQWLEAIVSNIMSFGAFCEVTLPSGTSTQGLVFMSNLQEGFVVDAASAVAPGQEVKVRLLGYKEKEGKLQVNLTMRNSSQRSQGDPEQLKEWVGTTMEGTVVSSLQYGAFVRVALPDDPSTTVEGLMHVSNFGKGYVSDATGIYSVGEKIEVEVLSVEDGKVSFTRENFEDAIERPEPPAGRSPRGSSNLDDYEELLGQWVSNGTVVNVVEWGAFIGIPNPKNPSQSSQGLLRLNETLGYTMDMRDKYAVGDTVKVRVLDIDTFQNQISLTQKPESADKRRPAGSFRRSSGAPQAGGAAPSPAATSPASTKKNEKTRPGTMEPFPDTSPETWLEATVTRVAGFYVAVEMDDPSDPSKKLEGNVEKIEVPGQKPEEYEKDQSVKVRVLGMNPRKEGSPYLTLLPEEGEEAPEAEKEADPKEAEAESKEEVED